MSADESTPSTSSPSATRSRSGSPSPHPSSSAGSPDDRTNAAYSDGSEVKDRSGAYSSATSPV